MASLFFYYVVLPGLFLLLHWATARYDRNTKLLVERERAQAMLALKVSQQKERDEQFAAQQAQLAAAAKELRARKDAVKAPSAEEKVARDKPKHVEHKVDEKVWDVKSATPDTVAAPAAVVASSTSLDDDVFIAEADDVAEHHDSGHFH